MFRITLGGFALDNVFLVDIKRSARQTTNKAMTVGRREMVTRVKNRYTSPISLFKDSLTLTKRGLSSEIKVRGKKLGLDKFKTSPQGRINQRGVYIKATIVKGQGNKIPTAFRAFADDKIFEREGATRLPIRRLYSVSPAQMANAPEVLQPTLDKIAQNLKPAL